MTNADPQGEHAWEVGWEGHRLAQMQRLARLSLAEKLQWLEDAQKLVRHMTSSAPRPASNPAER